MYIIDDVDDNSNTKDADPERELIGSHFGSATLARWPYSLQVAS